MKNDVMKTDMLKERLVALKTTKDMYNKKEQKRINGEISYIEKLVQANEFCTSNER